MRGDCSRKIGHLDAVLTIVEHLSGYVGPLRTSVHSLKNRGQVRIAGVVLTNLAPIDLRIEGLLQPDTIDLLSPITQILRGWLGHLRE